MKNYPPKHSPVKRTVGSFAKRLIKEIQSSGYSASAWRSFFTQAVDESRRSRQAIPARYKSYLRWFFVVGAIGAIYLFGLASPATWWQPVLLGAWYLLISLWLRNHLGLQRTELGDPVSRFGIPNGLTFMRLSLSPLLLISSNPQSSLEIHSLVLLVFLAVTDTLDGNLARIMNLKTELGRILDPIADIVFITVISIKLFCSGHLPTAILCLLIIRFPGVFIMGIYISLRGKLLQARPSILGKTVAAMTVIYLIIIWAFASLKVEIWFVDKLNLALGAALVVNIVYLIIRSRQRDDLKK